MTKTIKIIIVGLQLGLAFVALVCIYMVFALLDYEGGFDRFVGMIIFQPILAIVFSVLTIVVCAIAGLPLRLIKAVNEWWIRNFYIAILLLLAGLAMLVLSLTPQFLIQETLVTDGVEMTRSVPHGGLAITGWFFTAFSILHLYPPLSLIKKLQMFASKLLGVKEENVV